MIPVTKPHLPETNRYLKYIERCYENCQLTNNGPLAQELKARLEEYLGVQNLLLVANGTLALQIAYKALGISEKAITTPFTFGPRAVRSNGRESSRSLPILTGRPWISALKRPGRPWNRMLQRWCRSMSMGIPAMSRPLTKSQRSTT